MTRKRSQENTVGGAAALDYAYNDKAGALKQIPTYGAMIPMGDAATVQVNVGRGKLVAFYNNDSAVHFVAFGTGTVTAPTDPSNGIPLAPGMFIVLNTGNEVSFIADDTDVYWYDVQDDTYIQE